MDRSEISSWRTMIAVNAEPSPDAPGGGTIRPLRELRLRIAAFGTNDAAGRRYELWPEEKEFVMFYPRWVNRNLERRRYVFDYAWRIGGKSADNLR
jgi:hypothetical protein